MAGEDAGKEHKCDTQRDAPNAYLAQRKPHGDNHRDNDDRLQGRMVEKKVSYPLHAAKLLIIPESDAKTSENILLKNIYKKAPSMTFFRNFALDSCAQRVGVRNHNTY